MPTLWISRRLHTPQQSPRRMPNDGLREHAPARQKVDESHLERRADGLAESRIVDVKGGGGVLLLKHLGERSRTAQGFPQVLVGLGDTRTIRLVHRQQLSTHTGPLCPFSREHQGKLRLAVAAACVRARVALLSWAVSRPRASEVIESATAHEDQLKRVRLKARV